MKKWVLVVLAIILLCASVIGFKLYQPYREFTSYVDRLESAYASAKRSTDPADERRHMNMVAGCLSNISETYDNANNQERLAAYLTKHISQDTFIEMYLFILEYNITYPDHPIEISQSILQLYS